MRYNFLLRYKHHMTRVPCRICAIEWEIRTPTLRCQDDRCLLGDAYPQSTTKNTQNPPSSSKLVVGKVTSHQTGTTGVMARQQWIHPWVSCRRRERQIRDRPRAVGLLPRATADTSSRPASSAVSALCLWSTRLVPAREPSRVPWKPGVPTRPDRPRSDDGDGVRPRATTIPSACHAGFRLPRPLPAISAVFRQTHASWWLSQR